MLCQLPWIAGAQARRPRSYQRMIVADLLSRPAAPAVSSSGQAVGPSSPTQSVRTFRLYPFQRALHFAANDTFPWIPIGDQHSTKGYEETHLIKIVRRIELYWSLGTGSAGRQRLFDKVSGSAIRARVTILAISPERVNGDIGSERPTSVSSS